MEACSCRMPTAPWCEVAGDRVEIASSTRSLLSVLAELIDTVSSLTTIGPPAPHAVSAATRQELAQTKQRLMEVLA